MGQHMLKRPHIVEPVREFKGQHANVFGHSQKHIAKVFGLLFFFTAEMVLVLPQFGYALHDFRHFGAKMFFHVFGGGGGVF